MSCLSIAILQDEGVATLLAADIVVKRVVDALDLLLKPLRLVATLREWSHSINVSTNSHNFASLT